MIKRPESAPKYSCNGFTSDDPLSCVFVALDLYGLYAPMEYRVGEQWAPVPVYFKQDTPDVLDHQQWWWQHIVKAGTKRLSATLLALPMLPQRAITDGVAFRAAWSWARDNVWDRGRADDSVNATEYIEYMYRIAPHEWNWGEIAKARLTPVGLCHGDLTLENVLAQRIAIDPGNPRGLRCRELDEAKLLQSVAGWEAVKRNGWIFRLVPPEQLPFRVTRIHHVLFLSHLVRLKRHPEKHDQRALGWAQMMIDTTKEILT